MIKEAKNKGRTIHYLPPYRSDTVYKIAKSVGLDSDSVNKYASKEFIRAVVDQRNIKIPEEIAQMELAHEVTYDMYIAAMKMAKPGTYEYEIVGAMEGIVAASDCTKQRAV